MKRIYLHKKRRLCKGEGEWLKFMILRKFTSLDKNKNATIEIVVDRLVVKPEIRTRLTNSMELALSHSGGTAIVETASGDSFLFSENAACSDCGISYPEFTPASFSFNSPHGACPECDRLRGNSRI